jgi:hypothetical protein
VKLGLEDGSKLRLDTTVVETDMSGSALPTNWSETRRR